ncbi:MAG: energy-coupling factor transporter transmembrane component T [Oscillospiraceae bacterium]|nr:energy-coupling factor transporter transmembrane component T [Oscillospiraceae bacterium]
MKSAFASCHPFVNFIWFAAVITLSVMLMNPPCLAASAVLSAATLAKIRGGRALGKTLTYLTPFLLAAALINCLFNHAGMTPLAYFPSGNALTGESLAYGAAAAVMLASAVLWCASLTTVMTSDKLVCLFGKTLPTLGVLVAMTLSFIPRFAQQFSAVSDAQKCSGAGDEQNGAAGRLRRTARVFSITATWALEGSVQTADSMRSRGWGMGGRTSFSPMRFDKRDGTFIAVFSALFASVVAAAALGMLYWHYFPFIGGELSPLPVCAYAALCAMPLAMEFWEDKKWTRLKSKI